MNLLAVLGSASLMMLRSIVRMVMSRTAAWVACCRVNVCLFFFLFVSGIAYADSPSYLWRYILQSGTTSSYVYTSADSACAAAVEAYNSSTTTGYYVSGNGCYRNWLNASNGTTGSSSVGTVNQSPSASCSDGSAPDTSKPLDQQCAAACPTSGTSAGSWNITTAWANGPQLTANIQVKVVPDGGLSSQVYTTGGCGISASAGPTACYQSTVPSGTGLYRISCDVPMTYTGSPVSPTTTNAPESPPQAPPCPGTTGTVNGKPVCLDSSASSPPNTTPYPTPGNPVPGKSVTSGGSTSNSVDPATGTGSSSAPGTVTPTGSVTVSPDGSTSEAAGSTPDTGPKECGTPGHPKCQIDETGTPTGSDTGVTDQQIADHVAKREEQMGKKQEDLGGFSWKLTLPQGACTPYEVSVRGATYSFDWCPWLGKFRSVLGYFYVVLTMLLCYSSVMSAVKFNKG